MGGRSALFKLGAPTMVELMARLLAILLLLVTASPVGSQTVPAVVANDDPTAAYVTVGQDEPGYQLWYKAAPERAVGVAAFNRYLLTYQVGGIVPTWQLLRTASMWQKCGAQPFEIPPTDTWPNIVQTLRYVRDRVIPAVGPVEPVSAYRNPLLNACAGGAPESAHQHFQAVDLVPLRPVDREAMMSTLCDIHERTGEDYQTGLGFYAFLRFHIDTMRFRRWGASQSRLGSACRIELVHREEPPAPDQLPSSASAPVPAAVAAPKASALPSPALDVAKPGN